MASAENRKRARADDFSQGHRPDEKIKSRGRLHEPSNFPPEFWDNLSKVPLTRRALRELDRRNSARPAPAPAAPAVRATDRARFARHGGPDLRHLRGCHNPEGAAYSSRRTKSTRPTEATDISPNTMGTSANDDAFEQHMIDNSIYPPVYDLAHDRPTPKPNNLGEHRQVLSRSRPSLSASLFTEAAFDEFVRKSWTASESTVKRNVIPIIAGKSDIPNEGDLHFTNIKPMTEGHIVKLVPDFFDGARAGDICNKIRDADGEGNLNKLIMPTKHASAPVAPNFFLEIKAARGGAGVALRQALHDGAIGARAMYALQNYGAEEPSPFDGNAYTYSSTYHAGTGTLQLYAHHVTPPIAPGGPPGYHMTQLDSYAMTGNRERFIEGATAFRNARDLAQTHRERLIQAANARARQSDVEGALPEAEITAAVAEQYDESADEFVDRKDLSPITSCRHRGSSRSGPGDAEEEPGSSTVPEYGGQRAASSTVPEYGGQRAGSSTVPNTEDKELSQESTSLGAEPPMSFAATSFASSFGQIRTSSKRTRSPHSPRQTPRRVRNTAQPGGHARARLDERRDSPRRPRRRLQHLLCRHRH